MPTLYYYHRGPLLKPWRFASLESAKRQLKVLEPEWDKTQLYAGRHDPTRGIRFEDDTPIRRVIKTVNRMLRRWGHVNEELWSLYYWGGEGITRDSTMRDIQGRWALFAVEGGSEGFYAHWAVLSAGTRSYDKHRTVALAKWFCNDHATIYKMVADTAALLRV